MKTDQNARMHNTLSDLSTRRLSCEQTQMILKNYGKENNRGSDFRMRMQQTDSLMFYDVPYHKKIASTTGSRFKDCEPLIPIFLSQNVIPIGMSGSHSMKRLPVASTHKQRKLQLVGTSVRHIRVSATRRKNGCFASGNSLLCAGCSKFSVHRCHEVNGSESAIR